MANEITWNKVKLGDICTIKTGKLNANAAVEGGAYPFFTCSSKEVHQIDNYAFDGEALLISGNGDVGFTRYYNGKFNAYQRTYVLMDFKYDAKYIYYYLQQFLPDRIKKELMGGAMPYIRVNVLSNMEIDVTDDNETLKKVTNILSKFDELIQINEFKANNLIKAKTQLMNDIFSGGLRSLPNINPEDFVQSDWAKVKLGDIASIASGKGIKKSEYLETGTYPIIGANGEIGRCNQKNTTHKVITTGRVGTIGTIYRVNDAWITDNTLIIDLINSAVDFDYLYYSLGTVDFKSITTGNAQPLVTAGRLKAIEIVVPPTLQEQRQIASLLSSYDELIQLNHDKLSTVNKMKVQLMNQVFAERERERESWITVKLGDIVTLKNGYSFKSDTYDKDKSGIYKIVTIKNVTGSRFVSIEDCDTISELPSNIKNHQKLKIGDILISMTGNVGRVSLVNNQGLLLNQRVGLLENKGAVDSEFLYQIVSSKMFEDAMISRGHGAAQPNIGKDDIESYEIQIPTSIQEQQSIASLFQSYDSLADSIQNSIDTLEKEKNSIMQKIFA